MKKLGLFVFLSMLLVSSFVSAQGVSQSVEGFLNDVTSAIYPVARFILGSTGDANVTADLFAVKIFVLILVMVFVAAAVKRMPLLQDRPVSSFIVSVVVAIIGVRFITTPDLINLIWLPTSTLAVALTAIIPFAVFFFVIEGFQSSVLRRAGWTAYSVIYLYFAISRWSDPSLIFGTNKSATGAWIYLIIAGVSLILIFWDREVRIMFRRSSIANITDRHKRIQAVHTQAQIDDLVKELSNASTPADRAAIKTEIAAKQETLKDLLVS